MTPVVLVIDLEATCDDADGLPASDMEIIEIGAVWATVEGSVLDTFQALVRPVVRPQLTPFCRQLTNIQQADVDGAELFPAVADFSVAGSSPSSSASAPASLKLLGCRYHPFAMGGPPTLCRWLLDRIGL